MTSTMWSEWVTWDGSVEQTLAKGQRLAAGELSVAEARKKGAPAAPILHVITLDDQPRPGGCWVLAADELHQHFGSKVPPKKAIEAGHEAFVSRLERGQSIAVTAFSRGVPTAVLFAGHSDSTSRQTRSGP